MSALLLGTVGACRNDSELLEARLPRIVEHLTCAYCDQEFMLERALGKGIVDDVICATCAKKLY